MRKAEAYCLLRRAVAENWTVRVKGSLDSHAPGEWYRHEAEVDFRPLTLPLPLPLTLTLTLTLSLTPTPTPNQVDFRPDGEMFVRLEGEIDLKEDGSIWVR